jgi:hypothetical protein
MKDFLGIGKGQRQDDGPPPSLQDIDFGTFDRLLGWGIWLAVVLLLLLALNWARSFYTDWLWFQGLGQEDVLVTMALARAVLFVLAVVAFLALALPNLLYARRATGGILSSPAAGVSPEDYQVTRFSTPPSGDVLAAPPYGSR